MSVNAFRILTDWMPFFIIMGFLVYFLRKMGKNGFGARQIEYMAYMKDFCASHLEETRKISDSLQRIAAAIEKPRA